MLAPQPTFVASPPAAPVLEGPMISLTALNPGRCGWVLDVKAVSDDVERLKVMGVCAGRKVRLVRRGDPMILCIWGTRVGVSRRLAEQVMVQACPGPDHNADCHQWGDRRPPWRRGGNGCRSAAATEGQRSDKGSVNK